MIETRNSAKGWCVWITGLPGSGKSVVSEALMNLLAGRGVRAQLLSSDVFRSVVTPCPSYSIEERSMVYAALAYAAELLTLNGVNVVIDATGNLRRFRDDARKRINRFFEIYLECPLEICIEREAQRRQTHCAPRLIYSRATRGEAPTVPGLGQPYEPPLNPELRLDVSQCTPEECAKRILMKLSLAAVEEKNRRSRLEV